MTPLRVRPATSADDVALANLLGQLGYPASAEDVGRRLALLEASSDAIASVAEDDGVVIGLVTGHSFWSIHASEPVAWLTTLVVDEGHRRAGVGRALLEALEAWARARGAVRVSVSSGKSRLDAHAFYTKHGYEETGVRLTKRRW